MSAVRNRPFQRPRRRRRPMADLVDRFRLPEEPREDGFTARVVWDETEKKSSLQQFYDYVQEKNEQEIINALEKFVANITPAQSAHIARQLFADTVEDTKEVLLAAICCGSRPFVEHVLTLMRKWPYQERSGCADSEHFLPHMTPLLMACIQNNFAIVECLLLRGHSIDLPHHKNCACENCVRVSNSNVAAVRKVDALRALSSEAFLWLGTDDPFAAACALAIDLEDCIADDNLEFTDSYRQLLVSVQRFAARLVDQNWRIEELDIFLAHKPYSPYWNCEVPYPRAHMAVEAHLRYFIASPNVQRAMTGVWCKGWGNFGNNFWRDFFRVLRHWVLFPFIALLYICSGGKMGGSFDVPLARYISFMSSYMGMLMCLVGIRYAKLHSEPKTAHHHSHDTITFGLEVYFYLYVIGMFVNRYLHFSRVGYKNYFEFWWRWFDFLLIGVYLLALHLWVVDLLRPVDEAMDKLNRRHWYAWDYFLLYDIYFCVGVFLAVWRSFYFLQLRKGIGGSIISVGNCITTVYYYILMMGIVLFAFAISLNLLVQPYMGNTVNNHGVDLASSTTFISVIWSMRTLYFDIYGQIESPINTVAGLAGPNQTVTTHDITVAAIDMSLGLFNCILIVVFLNLMVSVLVRRADEVLENEELEFKYTRVVIYMEYLPWWAAVPPPLNLLHIAVSCVRFLFTTAIGFPEIFVDKDLINPNVHEDEEAREAYKNLLDRLYCRFISSKECKYRTVYRTDFEKDKPETVAKVAFMNG